MGNFKKKEVENITVAINDGTPPYQNYITETVSIL